jgi:hypothetical protein
VNAREQSKRAAKQAAKVVWDRKEI